jgi:hypothetical protein
VVFFGPKAPAELVPKFQVALNASHAAFPLVTLRISPYTKVTLTFDFEFVLAHPVHGGRKELIVNQRNYNWGHGTKTNWPTHRQSQYNLKLNLRDCTANYRPTHSEWSPHINKPATFKVKSKAIPVTGLK